jgi:hypothetical protein
MYSIPPGFSSLRLPLGDFVIYPTERPSIRTLIRQIENQGYSVQTYLFPNNNLRALPPSNRHWAVVIGDAILVIVPPSSSDSSVDPSDGVSSVSASCSSRISSIDDSDQVDPVFPWLGKGRKT